MSRWSSSTPTAGRGRRGRARRGRSTLDLPPGEYRVVLQKAGFGAKFSARHACRQPRRITSDCSQTGCSGTPGRSGCAAAKRRSSASTPSSRTSWNCGGTGGSRSSCAASAGTTNTARARCMQVTPDGDYTQTGVEWNKVGYANSVHSQHVAGPERSGLYYFRASTASGRQFAFPWIVAPAKPHSGARGAGVEHHLERVQQLRRAQQLHPRRRTAAHADRQRAGRTEALLRRGVLHLGRRLATRRCRSTARSRSTTSTSTRRSPTRSKAGRRATSRRPSGGCSAGWSDAASPTTTTPRRNSTTARSTSRSTACS